MDHEESGRKWVTKLRLDTSRNNLHPQHPQQTLEKTPQRSPNLPNFIELSPAARVAGHRAIQTEPRPLSRVRSNSQGRIQVPRVSLSPEDNIDHNLGLRRRKRQSTKDRKSTGKARPRSRYVIPSEHPFKIIWDILTVIVAIAHMRKTHEDIRDRQFAFGASQFKLFCDAWFFVDILLNFVTERRTAEGEYLRDYRSICARYLTSWFPIDILSLFPWETLYVQPLIEIQNRRGPMQKLFFRSRAVVKVIINRLRARHFRWFGNVAKHTKQHGVGYTRLFRLLIKYLPKYTLFFRNMKGIMAMRVVRQVRWFGRFFASIEKSDSSTASLSKEGDGDDISSRHDDDDASTVVSTPRMTLNYYSEWEHLSDDGYSVGASDDGVPL
mmetsp:Transcript_43653/g.105289  ORF Transcript_43653/g.105289 Transcript_43653/m.105289 type:complete len:382 (+) Transcript_43653:326-1471(+)